MAAPPPRPALVRELMRRSNTIDVYDSAGDRVVSAIKLGAERRPALLVSRRAGTISP
ncbi:MAG TPA: hypothetical protein VFX61_12740 [Micromonosporaceae bacterium]|nr:hypothetical protein [Micromonosporaceae bacterium]